LVILCSVEPVTLGHCICVLLHCAQAFSLVIFPSYFRTLFSSFRNAELDETKRFRSS